MKGLAVSLLVLASRASSFAPRAHAGRRPSDSHRIALSDTPEENLSFGSEPLNGSPRGKTPPFSENPEYPTHDNAVLHTLDLSLSSYASELIQMTRPLNLPVVFLMHMLGVYLVLEQARLRGMYWSVLLSDPSSWIALAAPILVAASSMVVNDYFDAKFGRDPDGYLASGRVPVAVVKRFCTVLYALAAIDLAFLPSLPARLLVLVAFFSTYAYTIYLKPMTWIKNLVCALIIGATPLVSAWTTSELLGFRVFHPSLWRLVGGFILGIAGREVMMDCDDIDDDRRSGVRTIPVVYGKRFATRVALIATASSGFLFSIGPLLQLLTNGPSVCAVRRLALACAGSAVLLRGAWNVFHTEGNDSSMIASALGTGLLANIPVLLSFV